MFNSEVYTFNCRINRESILVRRTEVNLSDYSTNNEQYGFLDFQMLLDYFGAISDTQTISLAE
jgi:hypothetical protein